MKNYKYLPIITGLFTAVLVISNILEVKIFRLFDWGVGPLDTTSMTAGTIIFPLAYVFGDILTEVYGYKTSRKVIWTGFLSLLLFVLFSWWAVSLPPASGWIYQREYEIVLNHMPRIVIASMIAYFCGEFSNSYVLAKLKLFTKGKNISVRFVLSTFIGQFIDTAVFVTIAFLYVVPFEVFVSLIVSSWVFKVLWEILALPVSVPLANWLKKAEKEDYFDKKTNFNPFVI